MCFACSFARSCKAAGGASSSWASQPWALASMHAQRDRVSARGHACRAGACMSSSWALQL
eukprot:366569-Chlamydomonas_euryale.AAC.31